MDARMVDASFAGRMELGQYVRGGRSAHENCEVPLCEVLSVMKRKEIMNGLR